MNIIKYLWVVCFSLFLCTCSVCLLSVCSLVAGSCSGNEKGTLKKRLGPGRCLGDPILLFILYHDRVHDEFCSCDGGRSESRGGRDLQCEAGSSAPLTHTEQEHWLSILDHVLKTLTYKRQSLHRNWSFSRPYPVEGWKCTYKLFTYFHIWYLETDRLQVYLGSLEIYYIFNRLFKEITLFTCFICLTYTYRGYNHSGLSTVDV